MPSIKQYKICRRLGVAIYEKCQTQKFNLTQSNSRRGGRRRVSDYGQQLLEKQKVRFMYGVSERQFARYVKESLGQGGSGVTPADALFHKLENRLDNVVYRLGLAKTRRMARQMVSHGHFTVNGKRTTSPSYQLQVGDIVGVREGSTSTTMLQNIFDTHNDRPAVPAWLSWDAKKKQGTVTGSPTDPDSFLNFQVVIEFYSR